MMLRDKLIALLFGDLKNFSDQEVSHFRLYLLTVLLTAPLLWTHVLAAYVFTDIPTFYQLGIVCATIHLLSPLLYKVFRSFSLIFHAIMFAGFSHIVLWTHYTGGIYSVQPIWFTVLPLIAGVVGTRRDFIIWCVIPVVATLYYFVLNLNGFVFTNHLSQTGDIAARVFIMMGLIFLNTVYMFVFLTERDRFNKAIFEKSEQINTLLTLVGHDISNPLTVINLSQKKLFKLLEDNSDEEIKKCLARINSCTTGIGNILAQIRDLQSIKQGKVELKFEKVYINDVVDYLSKVFESKLQEKEIILNYDFKKYQNVYVMGNATALKYQILGNLLSNAIKFSERGKEIKITIEETIDGVHIHLIDEGVGIDETLLDILFESNAITSRQGTGGEKGTGFGMSIVKTFVELSHGTIAVKSRTKNDSPDNHGTHFQLSFKKTLFS
ncbi:sensor histidine kinase [Halobacteriovorax sp. YZS-1-1]|uniref:sensor histidine kinase n=1 Tax=unclassified Halobacteriovorax TaxID=2639665 RepID=UPI00399975C1